MSTPSSVPESLAMNRTLNPSPDDNKRPCAGGAPEAASTVADEVPVLWRQQHGAGRARTAGGGRGSPDPLQVRTFVCLLGERSKQGLRGHGDAGGNVARHHACT